MDIEPNTTIDFIRSMGIDTTEDVTQIKQVLATKLTSCEDRSLPDVRDTYVGDARMDKPNQSTRELMELECSQTQNQETLRYFGWQVPYTQEWKKEELTKRQQANILWTNNKDSPDPQQQEALRKASKIICDKEMPKITDIKNDADSPGAASSTLNINTTSETQQHNTEQRINNLEQKWKLAKETHDELNRQNQELLKERINVAEDKHDIIDEQHTIIVKHG